ncbi:MAG: hypothetical protein WC460_04735 [Patescibacteria group bacterium]
MKKILSLPAGRQVVRVCPAYRQASNSAMAAGLKYYLFYLNFWLLSILPCIRLS